MISIALVSGDIDPELFLSTKNKYRVASNGSFVWQCLREVKEWVKCQPREKIVGAIDRALSMPFAFEQ